jgi:hypothetical protein
MSMDEIEKNMLISYEEEYIIDDKIFSELVDHYNLHNIMKQDEWVIILKRGLVPLGNLIMSNIIKRRQQQPHDYTTCWVTVMEMKNYISSSNDNSVNRMRSRLSYVLCTLERYRLKQASLDSIEIKINLTFYDILGRCRSGPIAPYWCQQLYEFYSTPCSIITQRGRNVTGNDKEEPMFVTYKNRTEAKMKLAPYIGVLHRVIDKQDRSGKHDVALNRDTIINGDPSGISIDVGRLVEFFPRKSFNMAPLMNTLSTHQRELKKLKLTNTDSLGLEMKRIFKYVQNLSLELNAKLVISNRQDNLVFVESSRCSYADQEVYLQYGRSMPHNYSICSTVYRFNTVDRFTFIKGENLLQALNFDSISSTTQKDKSKEETEQQHITRQYINQLLSVSKRICSRSNDTTLVTQKIISDFQPPLIKILLTAIKDPKKLICLIESKSINLCNIINTITDPDTVLGMAVSSANFKLTKLLIDVGADVNLRNKNSNTAIHICARLGDIKIMNLLLDNNGDINAPLRDGLTPLHIACSKGYDEMIQVLLSRGACTSAIDFKGRFPDQYFPKKIKLDSKYTSLIGQLNQADNTSYEINSNTSYEIDNNTSYEINSNTSYEINSNTSYEINSNTSYEINSITLYEMNNNMSNKLNNNNSISSMSKKQKKKYMKRRNVK